MNILLIATRDPRGPATGRKIVLRTIIRSLGALGHQLTVVAFGKREEAACQDDFLGAEITIIKVPSFVRVVLNAARYHLSGRMSLNECLYFSPRISRRVNQLAAESKVDLVVADMIRTAEYAARTGVPWFVDLDDLLSNRYESWWKQDLDASTLLGYYGKIMGRGSRFVATRLVSHLMKREARILRHREIDVARRANGVSLVSEPEVRHLAKLCGRPVWCLPMALDVGRDLEPQLAKRPMEMVFTGGLDYKPNRESLSYYAASVVPALREHGLGHLRLNVLGECPEVVRRTFQSEQLRLHGYVEDLHQTLVGYQLFLAPLQSGTGVKTKIVEAMLLGLPVVTTPIGVQGLEVRHGEHCYVWRTTEELVEILHEMEVTPQKVAQVAQAGMEYARGRFSPTVLERRWAEALHTVVGAPHCLAGPLMRHAW